MEDSQPIPNTSTDAIHRRITASGAARRTSGGQSPARQSARWYHSWGQGVSAALTSAFFLGTAPVFGRQAILLGLPPLAVAALRTLFAALLLLALMAIFFRKYLYIYPAGLLGCLLAGLVNGLGSLFYYSALGRIEASVGQLLYSLYPLFLVVWLALDRQAPSRLTLLRLVLALPAIFLLTQTGRGTTDWVGILQMLVAAALYALHLPINQRVLFDMPAPTVTVYTLLSMSAVVVPAYLLSGFEAHVLQASAVWPPLVGLTLATFFSRLTLFLGVKRLGGMQTAMLGLSEVLVTVMFAHVWLGERLSSLQWLGATLLIVSLLLVLKEKSPPRKLSGGDLNTKIKIPGWLSWLKPL